MFSFQRVARRQDGSEPLPDDENGFVLVWLAIVLTLLLSVAAFAVDLVHAYAEAQHLQNAVDAAALAGATQIPADLTGNAAEQRVREMLLENGYDTSKPENKLVENRVDPANPNQMNVQLRHTFPTLFGRVMGFASLSVRRTAFGQYDAKVEMGSPANNIGDVPSGGLGGSACGDIEPSWTAAECVNIPGNDHQNLFVQIQGKETNKGSGNAYSTAWCPPIAAPYFNTSVIKGQDGCDGNVASGGDNREYDSDGEFFVVHNDDPGGRLSLFVYDAGMVAVGSAPNACGFPIVGMNPLRHALNSSFCAGDQTQPGRTCPGPVVAGCTDGTIASMDTQFDVLAPDATPNNLSDNPPVAECGAGGAPWNIKGEAPNAGGALLRTATASNGSGGTSVRPTLDFFEKSVKLCDIPATDSVRQDYVIRVRAPGGQGTNNFSLIALHDPSSPPTVAGGLTISTRQRLPLFAVKPPSASPDASFFIARIQPAARDRLLQVELFDFSDSVASSNGTISITPYAGHASVPGGFSCTYTFPTGTVMGSEPQGGDWDPNRPWGAPADEQNAGAGCSVGYSILSWNGQWITINVVIPGTSNPGGGYTCPTGAGAKPDDCWLKLNVDTMSGTLNDATTWNAKLVGAPVRLVK